MGTSLIAWMRGDDKIDGSNNGVSTAVTDAEVIMDRERNRISPKAEIKDAVLLVPDEDVEIHGRWTGAAARIQCHTLYVEQGAVVEGNIEAQRVSVRGHLRGEVVSSAFSVQSGALVEGSVKCESMRVETRSRMRATISCDGDGGAGTDLPMPVNEPIEAPRLRMVSAGRAV